jgi:hypothetical protein
MSRTVTTSCQFIEANVEPRVGGVTVLDTEEIPVRG